MARRESSGLRWRAAIGALPPLVVLSAAAWWGTFQGVGFAAAAVGWLLLAALALLGRSALGDPLGLGGRWALVPWVTFAVGVAAMAASPVPRAGRELVALTLLLLLAPAGVRRCWRDAGARRLGEALWAGGTCGLALGALGHWWLTGIERPAAPLGHHNLLALWLVGALPMACAAAARRGWWWTLVVAVPPVAAVLATRSLAGAAGLLVLVVAVSGRLPRRLARARWLGLLLALAVLASVVAPRVSAIVAGEDASWRARQSYMEAAWRGFTERPLLGWGPGAAAWTLGLHHEPEPGLHDPGLIVTDPHSLALDVLYQSGAAGALVLGLLAWALARRPRAGGTADADGSRGAGSWALAALAVAFVGAGWFQALALLVLATVLVGLRRPPERPAPSVAPRWGTSAVALGLALVLGPLTARWHYGRALAAGSGPERLERLEGAVSWDPAFPLYRHRLALELAATRPAEAAHQSLRAADGAPGLASLALSAGALAAAAGHPGERFLPPLLRACALDPLASVAPRATWDALGRRDPELLARALFAEPRMLAASGGGEPAVAALQVVSDHPAAPAGWRDRAFRTLRPLVDRVGPADGSVDVLEDAVGEVSLSLFAFRRPPAEVAVLSVPVDTALWRRIDLLPVWRLPPTQRIRPDALLQPGCGLAAARVGPAG